MSQPQRRLGAFTATMVVVASMIGTGVFTTTGFLVADVPSNGAVLLGWLIGGLAALCGALSYGELAAALPENGGEYQLLRRIYHPAVGFVAGWISLVVGFSAPIAAAALAFGDYLGAVVPGVDARIAAVALILAASALHAAHVRIGGGVQNVFVLLKVGLIGVFVIAGAWVASGEHLVAPATLPLGEAILSPGFAVGLIFISFAYSGWNGAVYIAGELERPGRTLPRALAIGTAIVVALYVALNAVFLAAAPTDALVGVVEIGHVAAVRLFGENAGSMLSGLISLALVSSVSAMVMAGPRVYEAMGRDYRPLRLLARRGESGGPLVAIGLQAIVAIAMVLSASFETLLTYIGFTLSAAAALTVLGVFVLRRREPTLARPYRTWAYPLPPLVFLGLSCWMIVWSLTEKPVAAGWGLGTIALGGLAYVVVSLPSRRSARSER